MLLKANEKYMNLKLTVSGSLKFFMQFLLVALVSSTAKPGEECNDSDDVQPDVSGETSKLKTLGDSVCSKDFGKN